MVSAVRPRLYSAPSPAHILLFLLLLVLLLNPSAPAAPMADGKDDWIEDYYWLKKDNFCVAHWQCEVNVCKGMDLGNVLGRCGNPKEGVFYRPFPITAPFDLKEFNTMTTRIYKGCCKVRAARARARARASSQLRGAGNDAGARERSGGHGHRVEAAVSTCRGGGGGGDGGGGWMSTRMRARVWGLVHASAALVVYPVRAHYSPSAPLCRQHLYTSFTVTPHRCTM